MSDLTCTNIEDGAMSTGDIEHDLHKLTEFVCDLAKELDRDRERLDARDLATPRPASTMTRLQKVQDAHDRYLDALRHIAAGNISPSIGFAQRVLDGKTVLEAHREELAHWEKVDR